MEIDSALTAIQTLKSELQDARLAAGNAQLKPLPGESVRKSQLTLENKKLQFKFPLRLYFLEWFFSWKSALRSWAAPPSQSGPPWLSYLPALHKAMNTTRVGTVNEVQYTEQLIWLLNKISDFFFSHQLQKKNIRIT